MTTQRARSAADAIAEIDRAIARLSEILRKEGPRQALRVREIERAIGDVGRAATTAITAARAAQASAGPFTGLYAQINGISWERRVAATVAAARVLDRETSRAQMAMQIGRMTPARLARYTSERIRALLRSPLKRIAETEVYASAKEALLNSLTADEGVGALRWVTTSARPCRRCVALRDTDYFGLGAGVYPIGRLPKPPHPHCKCRLEPVRMDHAVAEKATLRDVAPVLGADTTRAQAAQARAELRVLLREAPATDARRGIRVALADAKSAEDADETIAAAAIRMHADGRVFQGTSHPTSQHAARMAGLEPSDLYHPDDAPRYDSGFITSRGRFVGRAEAARIAKRKGQLTRPLIAEDQDELAAQLVHFDGPPKPPAKIDRHEHLDDDELQAAIVRLQRMDRATFPRGAAEYDKRLHELVESLEARLDEVDDTLAQRKPVSKATAVRPKIGYPTPPVEDFPTLPPDALYPGAAKLEARPWMRDAIAEGPAPLPQVAERARQAFARELRAAGGSRVRLKSASFDDMLPENDGAHGIYDFVSEVMHIGPDTTRGVDRWLAGARDHDAWRAVQTVVHEMHHASSAYGAWVSDNMAAFAKLKPAVQEAARQLEESMVEHLSRRLTVAMGGSAADLEVVGSYPSEVWIARIIERRVGPDAMMSLYHTGEVTRRIDRASEMLTRALDNIMADAGMAYDERREVLSVWGNLTPMAKVAAAQRGKLLWAVDKAKSADDVREQLVDFGFLS